VQGAPLRHHKSVAKAGADAAPGPPYLCPSNLLLGALVRLPKLVPGAGAVAAAGPPYLRPCNLHTRSSGAPAKACFWSWGQCCCLPSLHTPFGWRLGAGGPTEPS